MRISTTMQFTNSLKYIQNSNSKVDETSIRYNTGYKFQKAGEDPSGMAAKIKYEGAIAAYTQYNEDGAIANNALSEEETAIASMWDTLSSINTRLQQCINGSNDASSLKALSSEIQQLRDHLFDLMNTQNTDGEYIFSGAQSDVPTYEIDSLGHYVCKADGATRGVVVAPNVTVQVSDSGLDIFENCKTAYSFTATPGATASGLLSSEVSNYGNFSDLFKKYYENGANNKVYLRLDNSQVPTTYELADSDTGGNVLARGEIDLTTSVPKIEVNGMKFAFDTETPSGTIAIELDPPKTDNMLNILTQIVKDINSDTLTTTEKVAKITKCEEDVNIALLHYDSYRGLIGARQNAIENVMNSNESISDIKKSSKAEISEIDAFEAASDLVRAQNQLSVSRQIYSMVNKQSLFDYI